MAAWQSDIFPFPPAVSGISGPSTSLSTLGTVSRFNFRPLIGVQWYRVVVSMCLFLMTHNVEYLVTCLLAVCVSFFGEMAALIICLFQTSSVYCLHGVSFSDYLLSTCVFVFF